VPRLTATRKSIDDVSCRGAFVSVWRNARSPRATELSLSALTLRSAKSVTRDAVLLVVETMLDGAIVFAYSSPVVSVEILECGTV